MAKYLDETGAEQLNQLLAAKFDTKVDKILATKTYTGIQGSGDDGSANYAFYYMSVKPNSFTEPWSIKYRIHIWIPEKTNFDAIADSYFMGNQGSINSYACLNHIYNTSYRPVYYQSIYRLLQAGYDAGYGHAFAMNMTDSSERATSGYARNFTVEILETKGCTVTLLDTPVLWANWTGTGTTNYNSSITSVNFSSNGLQEVGDANDNTIAYIIKSFYEKTKVGPNKLFQYNLCTYTSGDKLEGFVNSASTGTTKTKNTSTFRIGAPIYYYNSQTNLVENNVAADNALLSQAQTVDLRYSTNCNKTLTANLSVYLVGTPSGANFTLADTWWTQTLPNTADDKIYILLGVAYSTYQIAFNLQHPVYEYKNGAIRLYQVPATSSEITTALGYTPYSAENPNGYTSNTGTITKVQANGTDVASSGTANIPAATTSKYGVTELSSATNSTSEALAATPKAVKAAYDLAASKGTGTITGVSVNGTSVATSGVANITSVPASILSGAIPSAVTATTQTQGDNSTKIATTAYVDTAINNLPDPMIFKGSLGTGGTITALPVDGSANIGDTYKVITAGTYASKSAKVGDTFICLTKTSSANTWELIPSGDEPSGTVTSVTIKATSPIAIDSTSAITTSGTRTLSHANSGVTAGNYKSVTVNATGHVTAGENPTTLAGFGITDAKIANGIITLGSNTITPLTSASTLDATKLSGTIPSGCYTNTTYTFDTGDNNGQIKVTPSGGSAQNISVKGLGTAAYTPTTDYTSSTILPNDAGEVKTRYRISKKGYTGSGSTIWYYPICELPKSSASNYASVIVSGRIGGWVNDNMSYISSLIWNRDGTGIALLDIAGGASAMSNIWSTCDIVLYTNDETGKTTVYLKCKSYFTFDLDFEFFQSSITILYDGETYLVETPSGTLGAQASTSNKRVEIINSKLLVAGVEMASISGSQALTNKTYNGYTLSAACAKDVDTSISAASTSTKLPTSQAVVTFVEGKGYVTTDTKNTAGSTDTSSKIYLIGATSQATNPQTYSDNEVYATSGVLTAKSYSVNGGATIEFNSTDNCIEFNFA